MISFLNLVTSRDALDIALVTLMIYVFLLFIKQTKSYFIAGAIIIIYVFNLVSNILNLGLTRQLIEPILGALIVIFVVVFQKEIRRFFEWLHLAGRKWSRDRQMTISADAAHSIVVALTEMARHKIGALIVVSKLSPLDNLISGGTSLDGKISTALLLSIFNDQTPGHDGAVIVDHNRIRRFGAHLPLAENFDTKRAGTRHRAAVGLSERSDALVLVVSEERGIISMARHGKLETIKSIDALEAELSKLMHAHVPEVKYPVYVSIFTREWRLKLASILIATSLWFFFVFQIGTSQIELTAPIEFRHLVKEYELAENTVSDIKVIVSGNTRDVRNLKPEDLKVVIDLSGAHLGTQKINLDDTDVIHPKYLKIIALEPERLIVTVKPNTE
jgi:diadenylate cyclase